MNGESQKPLWPRATLAALTGLNLFNYLDRFVLSAVTSPIQQEFGLSEGQLGRLNTAFMLGYFVTSPFFGYLGDRAPRRWLVVAGIIVWSLGTVSTGLALTLGGMLVARAFVGLGEASYATVSPAWIADLFPKAKRNNALTIFYVAIPVGAALGVGLGGVVAEHQGWRTAFFWAGGPGLLLALLTLLLREPPRGASDSEPVAAKPAARDYLQLLHLPDYLLVVGGYTAYTFALGAFGYWGPRYLVVVHGMGNEKAALFFGGTLAVAGLFGTFIGGFAATAWQRRNPAGYAWILGLSVCAAAPVAAVAFLTHSTPLAMTCLAGAMLLLFLSTGPVNTLILETVPVNMRACAMAGSIFCIHLLGDFWSPEIVGHLADGMHSLRRAVMILPLALAVATVLWVWLALRTKRQYPVTA
ncbi:MAG: MFS transporter [Opitutus sp.]|nr:MFS transporter [Opitutus sp.]